MPFVFFGGLKIHVSYATKILILNQNTFMTLSDSLAIHCFIVMNLLK